MDWTVRKEQPNNPDSWEYEVIAPSETGKSHYAIASGMNETNANLIASAPKLYEACKMVFKYSCGRNDGMSKRFRLAVEQALAEADNE